MTTKRKTADKSSKHLAKKRFGTRASGRVAATPSEGFRKLAPAELKRLGLPLKSERYVELNAKRVTKVTPTLSKRQFYQKKLGQESGRPVTLEQRAREYLSGDRHAVTAGQAALRERSLQAWNLRRKYRTETIPRIRQHLRNMEIKAQGDQLDWEVYLREKAFAEQHLDVPEEQGFYQKWFNYGHIKMASRSGQNATGRSNR
jgi:hypothetical protein